MGNQQTTCCGDEARTDVLEAEEWQPARAPASAPAQDVWQRDSPAMDDLSRKHITPKKSKTARGPPSPAHLIEAESDMDEETAQLLLEVKQMVIAGKIKPEVYHNLRILHAPNAKSVRAVVVPPGQLHLILGFRPQGIAIERIGKESPVASFLQEGNIVASACGVDIRNMQPRAVQKLLGDHQHEHRTIVVLKNDTMQTLVEVDNMQAGRGRSFSDLKTKGKLQEVKELVDAGKVNPEMLVKLHQLNSPRPM